MATTSAELALTALHALSESGIRFAVLHGSDRLVDGSVSDVDLVVSDPPMTAVSRTREAWETHGLFPVVIWPYDIAGTATVFLSTEHAEEGVQLDLLFDALGSGKYGVRSQVLLDTATTSDFPPVITEEAELIYLWRKRSLKDQHDELAALAERAARLDRERLEEASVAITGSLATASAMVNGIPLNIPGRSRYVVQRLRRVVHRLHRPIGFWVHTSSNDVAAELVARFSRFLVGARAEPVPTGTSLMTTWWVRLQIYRRRPILFVSTGFVRRGVSPDLLLRRSNPRDAARDVVLAMSRRIP